MSLTDGQCTYHDAWDADGEPTGNRCPNEALRAIVWLDTGVYSPTCLIDHPVDEEAPPHFTVPLQEVTSGLTFEEVIARHDRQARVT